MNTKVAQNMLEQLTDEELDETLRRLNQFANVTDAKFRIPFTNIRFGLDALIGLIPVLGEVAGFLMSFYIVREAKRLGAPTKILMAMYRNMALDLVLGLIPIIGDIADIGFRANIRNLTLLTDHLEKEQQRRIELNQPKQAEGDRTVFLLVLLVVAVVLVIGLVLV